MIEEAYVSFETAKLLKDKGFDEPCWSWYHNGNHTYTGTSRFRNSELQKYEYSKSTQQLAMRWLREIHYLWIDIDPLTNYKWTWSIWFMNDPNLKMEESSQVISTYEEAVEAAIQYSLKNLI